MAGRSIETALRKAVNMIEDQLNLKGFAIGTFMDIEGAFNHTYSEVIRRAVMRQGVQGCYTIGYADDILVIISRMHLDALMGVMQQT